MVFYCCITSVSVCQEIGRSSAGGSGSGSHEVIVCVIGGYGHLKAWRGCRIHSCGWWWDTFREASPCCLSVLMTWQLASWRSEKQEGNRVASDDVGLEVTLLSFLPYPIGYTVYSSRKGLTQGRDSRRSAWRLATTLGYN